MQLSKYIELERKPRRGLMALEWVALAYVALTLLIVLSPRPSSTIPRP